MPKAAIPENESQRLKALADYQVLDTLEEQEFDNIVKLASFICDTPIALVSLIDENRQWFKAKVGLEVEETSRDLAFCAHAILEPDEMLIVEDATRDKRFADNALVLGDPAIRFYAGCPLTTPSGHSLGTLCAIDVKPKKLTSQQEVALQILATNVVSLLELRKSNIEREKLINRLAQSNSELERFAYVASHDLKEPLRMISSFTDLLEQQYRDQLDERAQKYIHYARSSANRMSKLVDDLLQYSRIDAEAGEKKDIKVRDIMAVVEKNLQDSISVSGTELSYGHLPTVSANPVRLSRLLQNLVENAIKYRKPDVQPRIHIAAEQEHGHWVISVKDNGIGIESQYAEKIFEPFQRLHSRNEYPGNGIGLAICRKLVDGLGGKIWVESEPEQGSVFRFTMPVTVTEAIPA